MNIGVLALQGDFREHIAAVTSCGHTAIEVRRQSELDQSDALILPGGESTAISLFSYEENLPTALSEAVWHRNVSNVDPHHCISQAT